MGRLIGIKGAIGSGKDTSAKFISDILRGQNYLSENITIIAFADRVKQVTATLFGISVELLYSRYFKDSFISLKDKIIFNDELARKTDEYYGFLVCPFKKANPYLQITNTVNMSILLTHNTITKGRMLLYFVSSIVKNVMPNFFTNVALADHSFNKFTIVSDVRYICEANAIRDRSGVIIEIINDNNPSSNVKYDDASETEGDQIKPDFVIYWDGSNKYDLESKLTQLVINELLVDEES